VFVVGVVLFVPAVGEEEELEELDELGEVLDVPELPNPLPELVIDEAVPRLLALVEVMPPPSRFDFAYICSMRGS
jgi:hypothetical protein